MLPFIPETIEQLKQRFPAALEKAVDANKVAQDESTAPGKRREHVFDFEDGIRLIVSVDFLKGTRMLHVSGSIVKEIFIAPDIKEMAGFIQYTTGIMEKHFYELSGGKFQLDDSNIFLTPGKGVPHWFIDIPS